MDTNTTFVKIIQSAGIPMLVRRSFEDIKGERWGIISQRPLVYLSDPHEALEKSMWCYLNGMVPLIGEKDPELTVHLATLYKVDSLIADALSLKLLSSFLFSLSELLVGISLLGTSFEPNELLPYASCAKRFRLVQVDSQGRAMAEAELGEKPVFRILA